MSSDAGSLNGRHILISSSAFTYQLQRQSLYVLLWYIQDREEKYHTWTWIWRMSG